MMIQQLPNHKLRAEIHHTVKLVLQTQDEQKKELLQKLLEEAAFRNLH